MKAFDKTVRIEHYDDVDVQIYVVGYPNEGESIVFSMRDKGTPFVTFVTDCYVNNDGYNHTSEVLRANHINQIDAFVWTHPDRDHSIGIVDLLTNFDSNRQSKVFVPSSFNGGQGYEVCDEAAEAIAFLMQRYDSNRQYGLNFVSLNKGEDPRSLYRINIIESTTGNKVEISLRFLLPNSALIERRDGKQKDFDLNDLSLVYVLDINGFNYLFTGDLVNQSVQFLDVDNMTNTHYIKIPHHGSDSSDKLLALLNQNDLKNVISVSTIFAPKNDPKPEILMAYQAFSTKVYCTGSGKHNFGCVKSTFDINGQLESEPSLFGNAYVFNG